MKDNTCCGIYRYMKDYSDKTDSAALIFNDEVLTYTEFFSEIDRVSRFLVSIGIRKGDTVCICLRNMPQIAVAVYAVNKIGARANMVHAMNTPLGLKKLMEETDSKALFIENLFYDTYVGVLPQSVTPIVCSVADFSNRKCGEKASGEAKTDESGRKFYEYNDLDGAETEEAEVLGDDICCYMHSGGTTGEPKTVELTNKNFNELVSNLDDSVGKYFVSENEVTYTVLPMFHGFGLGFGLHMMMCRRCALIMVATFDSADVGRLVEKYKVTLLTGVPMMFKKLAMEESFKTADLSTIHQAYCGGDALNEVTIAAINDAFKAGGTDCKICEGYGLTEAVSVVSTNRPDHIKGGTIGEPLCGIDVGIFDDAGNRKNADEVGEICVSAKTLMKGYHHDKETSESIIFKGLDGKTWLKTGDLGSMDSDGFITFKGRKKRIIIIAGYNVFPAEIEKIATEISGVKEACAVEGSIAGKSYVALFVETDKGEDLPAEDKKYILSCLAKWLPKWSMPKRVYGVKTMPRTTIGKIDFAALENTLK